MWVPAEDHNDRVGVSTMSKDEFAVHTGLRLSATDNKFSNCSTLYEMKKIILWETDESCDMARVTVNKVGVMEGNYHDFHNGCHGIHEYGVFNTLHELISRLAIFYQSKGEEVKIVHSDYKFEG